MVSFIAPKDELINTLKHLRAVVKGKSKRALQTKCEATITDGKVTFSVPGGIFSLSCQTKGVAKFTIKFLPFYDFVRSYKTSQLRIIVRDNEIQIENLTITANTCFINDDKILRTIDLPYGYDDKDILMLPLKGYTPEELKFNGITTKIEDILSCHESEEIKKKMIEQEMRRKRIGRQKNLFDNLD